jgi:hypothetical protein
MEVLGRVSHLLKKLHMLVAVIFLVVFETMSYAIFGISCSAIISPENIVKILVSSGIRLRQFTHNKSTTILDEHIKYQVIECVRIMCSLEIKRKYQMYHDLDLKIIPMYYVFNTFQYIFKYLTILVYVILRLCMYNINLYQHMPSQELDLLYKCVDNQYTIRKTKIIQGIIINMDSRYKNKDYNFILNEVYDNVCNNMVNDELLIFVSWVTLDSYHIQHIIKKLIKQKGSNMLLYVVEMSKPTHHRIKGVNYICMNTIPEHDMYTRIRNWICNHTNSGITNSFVKLYRNPSNINRHSLLESVGEYADEVILDKIDITSLFIDSENNLCEYSSNLMTTIMCDVCLNKNVLMFNHLTQIRLYRLINENVIIKK